MKKLFLIGTAVLGMFFMTTSCLDNTEPAGIEAMRLAKAGLIDAQAAYQQALADYQQAQIALLDAELAAKQLENQMKELELQQKQLELDLQEAQNEHEIRMMELEYLLAQEENNAAIAELKMQIAELELRQLQLEITMQDLENQKEILIQEHALYLLDLQTRLAQAQADYEKALRDIEAAKHGLTDAEQQKLDEYIAKIENIQGQLDIAENELIAAQRDVADLKFSYNTDSVRLYNMYEYNVRMAQKNLDESKAELEEVRNLDLTAGAEELIAQKTSVEEEIEALNAQIDDLVLKADAMEYEKEAPEAEIRNLQAQMDEVNNQIDDLYDQLNGQSTLYTDEVRNLDVPEGLARFVGQTVASNGWEYDGSMTVLEGFTPPDYSIGNLHYTLPGGVFSWRTTGYNNLNTVLPALISELKPYVLTAPGLQNTQHSLEDLKMDYNAVGGVKDVYENNLKVFRSAKAGYDKYAAEFGILNYTRYSTDNLFVKATAAYNQLEELIQKGIALDSADFKDVVTASLDAIRHEQEVRDTLFGNAYPGWENITYANLTSAADAENHIEYAFVTEAYYNSSNAYNTYYYQDLRHGYATSASSDTTDWCILQQWNMSSQGLYALDFSEVEMTLDYVGYGKYFVFDFNPEEFPGVSHVYYWLIGDDVEREKLLTDLGYATITDLFSGYLIRNYVDQFQIESAEQWIANNSQFEDVIADLETMLAELEAVVDNDTENDKALYEQIYALTNQLAEIRDEMLEQNAVIDSIDVEISKLIGMTNSEKAVIEAKIGRLNTTVSVLDGIIGGYEIEINGVVYNPLEENLEEIQAGYVEYLEYVVDQYEVDLQEAQDILDRLLASDDPFQQALEDAERELEKAEEAYNKLLDEFNFYNELLNDYITNVLGLGDGNPEA